MTGRMAKLKPDDRAVALVTERIDNLSPEAQATIQSPALQQEGMTIADTGGEEIQRQLRGIRTINPDAGQFMDKVLGERHRNQFDRVTSQVNKAFESSPELVKAIKGDIEELQNISRAAYTEAYIKFDDLEPSFGHLYHLCPTIPSQPKYIDVDSGEFLVNNNYATAAYLLPSNGGVPMGFDLDLAATATATPIGLVSPKLYIKHPVGSPINVLDQAPEGDSGSAAVGSLLGVSGFLDGTMSPIESPNWNYSLFIEHGENNLPAFRMVVDCEEYIIDGRVRLTGWKYSIAELSMSQLSELQSKGKVTYAIINPQGIPTSSSLSGPFLK